MTRKILSAFALILFGAMNCYAQSPLSKVGGKTYASAYAGWRVTIQQAPTGNRRRHDHRDAWHSVES